MGNVPKRQQPDHRADNRSSMQQEILATGENIFMCLFFHQIFPILLLGKKKKIKGTKMALTDFLADGSSNQAPPARTDWAAEMESNDMEGYLYFEYLNVKLERCEPVSH